MDCHIIFEIWNRRNFKNIEGNNQNYLLRYTSKYNRTELKINFC